MDVPVVKMELWRTPGEEQSKSTPAPKVPTVPTVPTFSIVCNPVVQHFDSESARGRFGWYTLSQNHYIPYLMRNGEKYCSTKMAEKSLELYLCSIHPSVYNDCTNIPSYFVTTNEMLLLNEINFFHCNCSYGNSRFSVYDTVVRMNDVLEFYKFLSICHNKLYRQKCSNKCGFVRINKTSIVPYVTINKNQYLPLFYFELAEPSVFKTARMLQGWPLSYLRFCFKVQAIRGEFVKQEECLVVCFDELKEFFHPETEYEEYWPNSKSGDNLINKQLSYIAASWHRLPHHNGI